MNTAVFSLFLAVLGSTGTTVLLLLTGIIFWRYPNCAPNSFRWHIRHLHLKQLSALASLFFLAMAASYALLFEAWALLYFVVSFKIGTWWLRMVMAQRA